MRQNGLQRILVYRVGQLGDTLVSLPAIRAIRKRHPHARLTLLTDAHPGRGLVSSWEILEPTGIFSEVIFYEPRSAIWKDWRNLWRVALQVRRLKPEFLYYLAPTPRTGRQVLRDRFFFHTVCGIRDSRGMAATDGWVGQWDGQGPVRLPPEVIRLLRLTGEPEDDVSFAVPVREDDRTRVDLLWRKSGLPLNVRPIALGPGAKMPATRWPADRYEALARGLLAAFPATAILIIGGKEDSMIAQAISQSLGRRAVNWAGCLTVLESAEALRRCALFVGNTSGVMHLAAAMGTRCVAIASARDHPGIWEPYGDKHIVLRKQVPCAGCLLSVCEEKRLVCLTSITVDEALQACLTALGGQPVCRV